MNRASRLAQVAVLNGGEDKTNEHKAALRSLQGLALRGCLVTGDAIFCHGYFCRQVIDAEGDYLVFVKDNQPTLLNDIRMAFALSRGRGFFPLGSNESGITPWTRRRPSTRDTVESSVAR